MQNLITQNQLNIATAQSLVSNSSLKHGTPPIGSYVRLPVDPAVRQQILDGLKPHKIREGVAFMLARSRFTDLSRECFQLDKFVASNGDHVLVHWEVALIKAAVVEDVFQELIYFKSTLEMTLAEELGVLGVRESDSSSDGTEVQVRGVYTHESGHSVENNYVHFSHYFPKSDALDRPHAVVVVDCVDQDDAFPYQSETRIRKDISSATMLVSNPASDAVAILEYSFIRIHKSPLATSEELDTICRHSVRGYFDLLVKKIRERLAWRRRPAGSSR